MADLERIAKELDELSIEELRELRVIVDARLAKTPPTEEEFERMLEAKGVLARPQRDQSKWQTEPFTPISVVGEPVSETIIRERR